MRLWCTLESQFLPLVARLFVAAARIIASANYTFVDCRGASLLQSIRVRSAAASVALAVVAGCHDNGVAPIKPAAIAIVAGNAQTGTVGQHVATSPTFVVNDE